MFCKCLKHISDYHDRKITKKECQEKIQQHGDELCADILLNGFSTEYTENV